MLPRVGLRVDSEIHDWLFRSRVAAAVGARPGRRRSNEALPLVRRARPPGVTLACMTLYDVMTDWSAWTVLDLGLFRLEVENLSSMF